MENCSFRVITMVIGLYVAGTMANTSKKSGISFSSVCHWNDYLLINRSFTRKHVDTSQTSVLMDVSFNCFSSLSQSSMNKEEWKINYLELSNNRLPKITVSTLAYLGGLEILNPSNNAIHFISLDLPSLKPSWVKRRKSRNGLLLLKVLILQRNKLSDTPKGLWKLKSLQSLDLSWNGISQIGLTDFQNCLQLKHLNLKSNKIFRIHPEAFRNLKKLQVVYVSNNGLTTILPMTAISLELLHQEVDLASNQWRCGYNMIIIQHFSSESWRKMWDKICNKSIGNEEAFWPNPQSRISRETHHPHNLNHVIKLLTRQADRPQAGMSESFSTSERKEQVHSDVNEKKRLPRRVRDTQAIQTLERNEVASQDLLLAVCLSVFITFFVAFCLGALTRPYIDRLWQHRCPNKSSNSAITYSNEGFYDEIEGAGNIQLPTRFPSQSCHGLNLCENQDASTVTSNLQAVVTHDRHLGSSRKGLGSQQSTTLCGNHPKAGNRHDNLLPYASAAQITLHAANNEPLTAAQDHIYKNDSPRELIYETATQQDSLSKHSLSAASVATGRLQTVSGSILNDSNELNPSLSREMVSSFSNMLTHTNTQRTRENKERERAEQLHSGMPDSQLEFSKEIPMSTYINLQGIPQQVFKGMSSEEEHSSYYTTVTPSDPGDMDPSVCHPRWNSNPDVTPAYMESLQNYVPSDTQSGLDTDYDSDEGSLFTISSTGTEGERSLTGEDAYGEESHEAREPLEDKDTGNRTDDIRSLENLEDINIYQDILGKYDNQEVLFEDPLVSGPGSGLCETHLESASNTNDSKDPLTLPGSRDSSPVSVEIPGTFIYDNVIIPQSEAAQWHCSLRDLESFSDVDIYSCPP
ncbi:PREDICTED: leucine-rich repeat-containing protein 66 [Chrysochloris asiatica]|uniref:Leucine-rich repeat-containing protein 66 n=1 Tax=Chrysochloris asiatica TaxID=185453 RepID=A0A9B0WXW9_CHRAS|nr:PREDICTED: leucine-rich repeat-containing protein 66 [Chrysochloris asiatica]